MFASQSGTRQAPLSPTSNRRAAQGPPLSLDDLNAFNPSRAPATTGSASKAQTIDYQAQSWQKELEEQDKLLIQPIPEKEKELPHYFFGQGYKEEAKQDPLPMDGYEDAGLDHQIYPRGLDVHAYQEEGAPPTRPLRDMNVHNVTGIAEGSDQSKEAPSIMDDRIRFASSFLEVKRGEGQGGCSSIRRETNMSGPEDPMSPMTITVFGFPPSGASAVLGSFRDFGEIISQEPIPPPGANWLSLTYATRWEGLKALARNGSLMGGWMVGVVEGIRGSGRADPQLSSSFSCSATSIHSAYGDIRRLGPTTTPFGPSTTSRLVPNRSALRPIPTDMGVSSRDRMKGTESVQSVEGPGVVDYITDALFKW
ncbi:hypothetical protein BJ684DRAFT_18685 [Piptocephalis cylindrospora]|uniref:RRM Nup35-type domain-containing protein n=1 Tax=Piptocephalis cylindrospora TaxID=1907219 RepID=A0A4P9Y752_9FUNG|nr:hypothetical protein BJ684DRAFT_18685 [Piptocephalis cylindrospora]|eukprot:RKP14948.1 hypothetical protein BJ684DRAFT_18685 [Piptocephalis cylindrospora]